METGYQRGRIQDESMLYEQRKHDGSLPLIGVNTFLPECFWPVWGAALATAAISYHQRRKHPAPRAVADLASRA
jgi:methylmalonyl-CoA mutase N-terminal domain/subunit